MPVTRITKEFLLSGASARGGWTREQLALLGVAWPSPKGWKRAILDQSIDDTLAAKFVELGRARQQAGRTGSDSSTGSDVPASASAFVSAEPVQKPTFWLYVLELANNNRYVGMSRNVERRLQQHRDGTGSQWTTLHPPVRLLRCADTGLASDSEATRVEDALTIQTMAQFGRRHVRGGQYCAIDQAEIDAVLLRHGHWDRIERAALERRDYLLQSSWHDALERLLTLAQRYYLAPSDATREALFSALYGLTRYQFWHSDFEAALDSAYWSEHGILPVLLSFRYNRPLASQCQHAFCVLAGAMQRRRRNGPAQHHLFLSAWTAFKPPATAAQEVKIAQWRGALPAERDRRYDEFTAVLLPQMRYLLRS